MFLSSYLINQPNGQNDQNSPSAKISTIMERIFDDNEFICGENEQIENCQQITGTKDDQRELVDLKNGKSNSDSKLMTFLQ